MEFSRQTPLNRFTLNNDTDECDIIALANRFDQGFFIEGIYNISKKLAEFLVNLFDFYSPETVIERLQCVVNDLSRDFDSCSQIAEDGHSCDVFIALHMLIYSDQDIVSRITSEL